MLKAVLGILAAAIGLAAFAGPFEYVPLPRWTEEPETQEKCAAVRAECPALAGLESIEVEVGYDEVYDADGMLVGLRLTRSTGCKPIDEALLLSQRRFKSMFSKPGVPDLDATRIEMRNGANRDDVRILKAGGTQLSLGCN